MTVVCATDLTDSAGRAEVAAAHLAARLGGRRPLVHAVDLGREEVYEEPRSAVVTWARRHLDRTAIRLRRIGCDVDVAVEAGSPEEVVSGVARRLSARVVVVAPHGSRLPLIGHLGSHTERLVREAPVPVLMVRDERPFVEWAMQGRPLRVLVGVDHTASSERALRWVVDLCRSGPCDVIAAHVYWPPGEVRRLGLRGASTIEGDPEIEATLRRDLGERVASLAGPEVPLRVDAFLGRVADRLIHLAGEERADLIAVGAHRKGALARLWEGSVSRDLLHHSTGSVVCVPAVAPVRAAEVPHLSSVLVATDFSAAGDAAALMALAAAAPGATLHLVHVLEDGARGAEGGRAAARRLEELVPPDARPDVVTQVHVLPGEPAEEICHLAERLGADLLCLGSHGRSGPGRVHLGSVAQAVVARTRRPVLLARSPAV